MPLTSTKSLLLLTTILTLTTLTTPFKPFGMNKPHYLFHLGDRRPLSSNLGWGYWADSQPLRMKYANTDNDIYAHMVIHDGDSFFQEDVEDRKSDVLSRIRYRIGDGMWESQVEMENKGAENVTWFVYFSVENNDYKLVDHDKHTSYIYIVPKYSSKTSRNRVQVNHLSYLYPNQTITITQTKQQNIISTDDTNPNTNTNPNNANADDSIGLFGVTANISQTYTVNQIAQTFKHLIRTSKGEEKLDEEEVSEKNTQRKEKSQKSRMLEWERKQLELIKQDKWHNRSYVVLFTYGTLSKGQKTKIYLTNSTSQSFNHTQFTTLTLTQHTLYSQNIHQSQSHLIPFVRHVISNLYGGMAFYYGRLYTQNSLTVHKQDYSYSFTPSRLIFPRSFLWDDGFHQSVVVNYDVGIVMDVLTNWMNKIDVFGWIGREQIRGGEISSMMPDSRFVFQDWFEMNPPTLMLSLTSLLKKSPTNPSLSKSLPLFLTNYYRKLQMWYRYFKNTQSHQSLQYQQNLNSTDRFFRWHCKDQCSKGNFMGSGLDDYPRRHDQVEIAKEHVDLLSWLYFFGVGLGEIGEYMEKYVGTTEAARYNKYTKRVKFYKKQASTYLHKLYESFLDPSDFLFKDIVVTKHDLYIQKFVNKIGYINLFPFFTGMLSEQSTNNSQFSKYAEKRVKSLRKCLDVMGDEKLLMSEDGLRSLSYSDNLYGTDENYWRGAVWLPINYMVLRACKLYYWDDSKLGPEVRQLYAKLRQRLIKSVYNTYKQTGYLHENYYQGRGHRGFPFYGWTSTIVNIITQQY